MSAHPRFSIVRKQPLSQPHVLVVDDDANLRCLIRKALEIGGYRVTVACNGREALQFCQDNVFELVLTDWEMPGMNGDEFLEQLIGSGSRAHFLVVTGVPEVVPRIWPCLAKPFSLNELLLRVSDLVQDDLVCCVS